MLNLTSQGKTYDDFLNIFNDKNIKSIDDFKKALRELSVAAVETAKSVDSLDEGGNGSGGSSSQKFKDIAAIYADLDKIDSMLEKLGAHKKIPISDILDLAKTHPEILSALKSLEDLEKK